MNAVITVNGRSMSKIEFFDFVFDTFHEADTAITAEAEQRFSAEYNLQKILLTSLGWMAEYRQWIANGCE